MANFNNGATVSSVLLTVLVLCAELIPAFKNALASVFGHHWVGKLAIVLATFVIISFVWKSETVFGKESGKVAWYSILGSIAVMLLFYTIHYLVV